MNILPRFNKTRLAFFSSLLVMIFSVFLFNSVTAEAKPSVLYVYSDACRMCNVFEDRVLSAPDVKEELSRFNFKKVHARNAKVHVTVTPTIFIYNSKNEQVKKIIPTLDKNKFLNVLRSIDK